MENLIDQVNEQEEESIKFNKMKRKKNKFRFQNEKYSNRKLQFTKTKVSLN